MMSHDFQLVPFVPQEASDQEWEQFHAFTVATQREKLPEDPTSPLDYLRQGWLSIPDFVSRRAWVLRRPGGDGTIVATGYVDLVQMKENRHVAQAEIAVLPAYRQLGLGRRMLGQLAETAEADGRRLMIFVTLSTIPAGEAFMQAVGAQRGLEATENQLTMSELNSDLVRQWQERAQERAARYELVFVDGAYPDELLAPMVQIKQSMNQAPTGDLDVEDFVYTEELLRDLDNSLTRRNIDRWTFLARQKGNNEIAGYTEVMWSPAKPAIAQQGDTAVAENHRHLGLGRWLKAAMLERVLRERPGTTHVRTGNANSNEPMLKINYELGFRPYIRESIWQLPISEAKSYLQQ